MAHKIGNRIKETASTSGTGSFTLAGAVSGFATFASKLTSNGDTTWYCAVNGTEWEVGLGTRTSSTVLARTSVYASSNSGSLVNFTNAPTIFCDMPAEKLAPGPAFRAYLASAQTGIANTTWTTMLAATEDFDTDGCYDTSTGRFTPNVAGYYHLDYGVMLNGAGLTEGVTGLFKNGTLFAGATYHGSAGNYRGTVGSCLVYLNGTTDYVEVKGQLTASSSRIFYAGTDASYFSGHLARPE
jgi:hypothetical protein